MSTEVGGFEEGSVIARKDSSAGGQRLRTVVFAAGAVAIAVAWWIRILASPAPVAERDAGPTVESVSRTVIPALRSELQVLASELETTTSNAIRLRDGDLFRALPALLDGAPDRGIIVFDSARAIAWAGKHLVNPSEFAPGLSAIQTPFYTIITHTAVAGSRWAEASAVIHAEPPADRIAAVRPLATEIDYPAASFSFSTSGTAGGVPVAFERRRPILWAFLSVGPADGLRLEGNARLQSRGALAIAFLILVALGAAWRERKNAAIRIAAIAMTAVAVWLVPWSSFSNFSRIFDPAFFYSPLLGRLSSNAGALLFTGVLFVLLSFAMIRAWGRRPPGSVALAALPLIASGVAIMLALSKGIGQPPLGATPALWLSWQLPLFLVLFAFVLPAGLLLRPLLGGRATVYRVVMAAGLLAAGVATRVVFSEATAARMQLAEQDLASLDQPDDYTLMLLRRFANDLVRSGQPSGAAALLREYAASDLIAAGIPASLTIWQGGVAVTELNAADITADGTALQAAIREAAATQQIVIRKLLGGTGKVLALAIPHGGELVTSAVVSARSRLISPHPQAALLGLPLSTGGTPPYSLTLSDRLATRSATTTAVRWQRIGNEYHADRLVLTSLGVARAHAEVDLRSPFARLQRGVMVVLFDLVVAALLWLLAAYSERGFARWAKRRIRLWLGTYRARLTLALFLFFTVPALAFSGWSYQRLRDDSRAMREVLISEQLRKASEPGGSSRGDYADTPSGIPILRYEGGVLRDTGDDILDAISPFGRMLSPQIHDRISRRGEVTAAEERRVAGGSVVVGYRAGLTSAGRFVIAAPARTDELVLDQRGRDLGILVLFATALGALAALWLSGRAARTLARDLELSRIEVARAERVLAWGEMARQVAHEIKNPLTPIRLGVQHLRRARNDKRVDFDRILDDNVTRILSEIDRLDEIARAFSRYGSAPTDLPPPERIDAAAILRDVIALERIGEGTVDWSMSGADRAVFALARADELRDVLLNVFENARQAGARRVSVSARAVNREFAITTDDNGSGIAQSVLPRVFEPHFSTRTTGSGLGLAVSRRLVESWGGKIEITSTEGKGTRVIITLVVDDELSENS